MDVNHACNESSSSPVATVQEVRIDGVSFHLPQRHPLSEARPNQQTKFEKHRVSQTSSVYNDDLEWNRRVVRLSLPPIWPEGENQDALSILNELVDELPDGKSGDHDTKHVNTSILEKGLSSDIRRIEINRDLKSRNLSIVALIFGIAIGIASLAAGCRIVMDEYVPLPKFLLGKYMTMGAVDYPFPAGTSFDYISGHRVVSVPEAVVLLLNLILNVCLTAIFNGMSFIQSTTLRWALCKEGRLQLNSNPRLFTGARNFAPNWRLTNMVSSLALIMGYGSISVLTCSIYILGMSDSLGYLDENAPFSGGRYAIDFNGWGLVGLGISLTLQGAVCSWCLAKSKIVPTWSSNPFNTALICNLFVLAETNRTLQPQTPALGAVTSPQGTPRPIDTHTKHITSEIDEVGMFLATPQARQLAMRIEVPRSRKLAYFIWIVLSLVSLWIILNVIFGLRVTQSQQPPGCTKEYVEENYNSEWISYWQSFCQIGVPYYYDPYFDRRDWLGLIIQCLGLSFFTLSIHCAEVITNIARDEAAWRKATTMGADTKRGAVVEGATSWECWVMFAFQTLTPWIFSFAFVTNLELFSNLIPLLVLWLIILLMGLFCEYLLRRRPKGPQPSTYGNIAKLAGLVDEWHPRLFWGDKGMVDYQIRKAGTAGQRLADLDMSMLYSNLRTDS